jgi:hypothetical protein
MKRFAVTLLRELRFPATPRPRDRWRMMLRKVLCVEALSFAIAALMVSTCGDNGAGPTGPSPTTAPLVGSAAVDDSGASPSTVAASSSPAESSSNPSGDELNCTMLQERSVRFSDPGFVDGSHVGLFYLYVGAPNERARLEIFWDEENDPTNTQIVDLGWGEVQRDDDNLSDHTGVIEHSYTAITQPTEKVVRANFIISGKTGNCATVRRITITPGTATSTGGGFTQSASLTTLFATNNNSSGNTFDIVPSVNLQITGFDVNLSAGPSTTIAVYYRSGTAQGNESTPAGWSLVGTDVVVPAGPNAHTAVNVGGVVLQAGQTYGFYIHVQSVPGPSFLYTNGGPTTFSNGDLSLTTFHGKGNPAFTGASFFPRQWNGTVKYRK